MNACDCPRREPCSVAERSVTFEAFSVGFEVAILDSRAFSGTRLLRLVIPTSTEIAIPVCCIDDTLIYPFMLSTKKPLLDTCVQ